VLNVFFFIFSFSSSSALSTPIQFSSSRSQRGTREGQKSRTGLLSAMSEFAKERAIRERVEGLCVFSFSILPRRSKRFFFTLSSPEQQE